MCCDHRSDRSAGNFLPSDVFCTEGRFFPEGFMASLFTVMFVAVMCYVILMLFKYLNKKKDGQEKSSMIKKRGFCM